jgi:hypothetical protein
MNMRQFFIIIIILFFYSCYHYSQTERELQHALQSTITLDNISNVGYTENDSISFDHIRQQFKYITLVFLQAGCGPCYPNFIRWHTEMQKLNCPENHALLFIIKGRSYNDFMANVHDIQSVEGRYYVVMDTAGRYIENNQHVPRWIIERSVLIDADNRIKLVGEPFANPDMTKLFYSIISEDGRN